MVTRTAGRSAGQEHAVLRERGAGKSVRQGVMGGGLAMLGLLAGCGGPPQTASLASPAAPARFTVQTPIDRIASDEGGKAVLVRDVPGVMASHSYVMFSSMSLSQLASLSGGRLTQAKLDKVNADLAELSPGQ